MAKVDTAEKGVMLEKLSFSFMPYLTARTLREMYTPLVNYLAQQVNIEIEFRIPGDYVEHNRLIGEDQVDITLVGECLM